MEKTRVKSDHRALLVGAYERDNFGDQLFFNATATYFGGAEEVVASSIVERAPQPYFDVEVKRYSDCLAKDSWPVVWVVGGEIGAISLEQAFEMTLTETALTAFRSRSASARSNIVEQATGLTGERSPYLPRVDVGSVGPAAPLVIHSVGLSGLAKLRGQRLRVALTQVRSAVSVTVRDFESSRVLDALGVPHALAPDIVHSLVADLWTPDAVVANRQGPLVFQAKARIVESIGAKEIARSLAESSDHLEQGVRFLSAGGAPGHDSIEAYHAIADHLTRLRPGLAVSVSSESDPIHKLTEIANASAFVGTSLHGMIISMSAGTPYVTTLLEKLDAYRRTWGGIMPHIRRYSELPAALDEAMAVSSEERAAFANGLNSLSRAAVLAAKRRAYQSHGTELMGVDAARRSESEELTATDRFALSAIRAGRALRARRGTR